MWFWGGHTVGGLEGYDIWRPLGKNEGCISETFGVLLDCWWC